MGWDVGMNEMVVLRSILCPVDFSDQSARSRLVARFAPDGQTVISSASWDG